MTAPWPPWSWANRDHDRLEQDCWEAREDPREFLPEADLDQLADRGEDAYLRYVLGYEGMDSAEAIT